MKKNSNKYLDVINIFFSGIAIYFRNLDNFLKYMAFPVLGQLVGIVLIFFITYLYAENIPNLARTNPLFDNILVTLSLLLLLTLPVFFLLCKSIYDYLIALSSLNSLANNLTAKSKNKILDTKVHDELIKRRLFNYILLLFVMSFIYLIGSIPFVWVILIAFIVYSCLTFQVFALEENAGPIFAIKRSFMLIKDNFWATSILLVLLFGLTFVLLPNVIVWAFDEINVIYYLAGAVEKFVNLLPIDAVNQTIQVYSPKFNIEPLELARLIVSTGISSAVIGFTLPLRSCACTLWYKYLDDEKIEENRKATKLDGRAELKKIMRKPKKESS